MPYYFERVNFAGVYMPQLSDEKPRPTNSEGAKRHVRNIVQITQDEYEHATLAELQQRYAVIDSTTTQEFLQFKYTNYKGTTSIRSVVLEKIIFTAFPDFHGPSLQWFLVGYDTDKKANRNFRLADCDFSTTTMET